MPEPRSNATCAICGHSGGRLIHVREMMFGTRERFAYHICDACGCCQLLDRPTTEQQYPPGYHASQREFRRAGLRGALRRARNRAVARRNVFARALSRLMPHAAERWFSYMQLHRDHRILDVGCGNGELVRDLREAGFSRAEGIDPLLPEDMLHERAAFVRKVSLEDARGAYDVVMLHHVLEHLPDQEEALRAAARLMAPGGYLLVRIPVLPNAAWERYREHWVQLDAPRHRFIHTPRSLEIVARRAGLQLEHMEYDSTDFQFTGSELYLRDVSLNAGLSTVSRAARRRFAREARALNAAGRGDQAAFYFRRAT